MILFIKLCLICFVLIIHRQYFKPINIKNNTVIFYNWTEYVPTSILEQFTQETGIKVIYSTYESNESMYAKLKTYNQQYDLVVPSTYFVTKMRQEGMLHKIDKTKLTNFKYLDPKFLNKSFDIHNMYSVPYIWGATAIGINTKYIHDTEINSWIDLWNPKYYHSISLLDDAKEVFQVALLKLGLTHKIITLKNIQCAYLELKKLMPNVVLFNSDNPGYPFAEGAIKIGMLWNGSAYVIKKLGVPIKFIWPKEGGIFWLDSFVIPHHARNINGALKLINFLLRPDIAAKIVQITGYSTPNLNAKKFLPFNIIHDDMLFPNENILKNGIWQNDADQNIIQEYETDFQQLKNI
ncbi:extracellular solute-binding protein [Enterobacteriaceae endosymbiont of Macroplea appendiculata]|uniref:extracellular solute-binding protein n=1 Tax=Enterobacteriaceae endosymbiont of Macroplea appendiculata TaxID=2675790 RepID=UPI0014493673|nr:extracellular solute-binding protein [Enterobacteriaceae endosymbiont of Macroplea appendiculata]QJC30778.1 extracellular solute-binding protein [Enterobacteriaceae endosymbiont of Macroplea appendiculata]